MSRFSQDDDDDFRDELGPYFDSDDDDDDEGGGQATYAQVSAMEAIQLDLVEMEMNQRLLDQAIQHCQSGFWWPFMWEDARQAMIDRTFARFRRLVTLDDSDKE